ncbi:MAG: hypothetical protein PHY29_03125 [Syntrophales bacterium]|nr:hypothetical protein [Syntrophales bacterium]
MEKEQVNKKKIIAEALKRLEIIGEKDTGQVILHIRDGGVATITKQVEVK